MRIYFPKSKTLELDSSNQTVHTEEAATGNVIADPMRDGEGAEIGVANGIGIKAKKIYAPDYLIKRKDILSGLLFGNIVDKLGFTGSQV